MVIEGIDVNSDELIVCIGKAEDTPEVMKLLADLGVTRKLRMPRDHIYLRVDRLKQGLSLFFWPESPKSSKLNFNFVQFVSDVEQGYKTFPGTLPQGLVFSNTRAEVHAKLGKPAEEDLTMKVDEWKLGSLGLSVDYARGVDCVAMVSVGIPFPS